MSKDIKYIEKHSVHKTHCINIKYINQIQINQVQRFSNYNSCASITWITINPQLTNNNIKTIIINMDTNDMNNSGPSKVICHFFN